MADPTTVAAPAAPGPAKDWILEIDGLKTQFPTPNGVAKVLDGLNLHVGRGEIVGLVGESGSGKSVTGFSIVRLLKRPGKIVEGSVKFDGNDLVTLSEKEIEEIRGKQISMIFQNPRSSLNPVISVGKQISQVLRYRRGLS
ncbi:MAG: ATP-binding cassette domain-containing protein, partial [Thermomicrobiales bacterium]